MSLLFTVHSPKSRLWRRSQSTSCGIPTVGLWEVPSGVSGFGVTRGAGPFGNGKPGSCFDEPGLFCRIVYSYPQPQSIIRNI